jgi:hypothetical protein
MMDSASTKKRGFNSGMLKRVRTMVTRPRRRYGQSP